MRKDCHHTHSMRGKMCVCDIAENRLTISRGIARIYKTSGPLVTAKLTLMIDAVQALDENNGGYKFWQNFALADAIAKEVLEEKITPWVNDAFSEKICDWLRRAEGLLAWKFDKISLAQKALIREALRVGAGLESAVPVSGGVAYWVVDSVMYPRTYFQPHPKRACGCTFE